MGPRPHGLLIPGFKLTSMVLVLSQNKNQKGSFFHSHFDASQDGRTLGKLLDPLSGPPCWIEVS